MTDKRYQVIFEGKLIPPINQMTALRRVAALYNVKKEQLRYLFDGASYCIKSGEKRGDVMPYFVACRKIGLDVQLLIDGKAVRDEKEINAAVTEMDQVLN